VSLVRADLDEHSALGGSICATVERMVTVGLRELRQQASELVRRVEAGEAVTVTVSGRASARLVPVTPRAWRRWEDVTELFAGPADEAWDDDRRKLDETIRDPWPH
jgi:prevent-host-death family protein